MATDRMDVDPLPSAKVTDTMDTDPLPSTKATDPMDTDPLDPEDPDVETERLDEYIAIDLIRVPYPPFVRDTDFETLRKITPHWKNLEFKRVLPVTDVLYGDYSGEELSERQKERSRFVPLTWPRDPNGVWMDATKYPDGKMTNNGIKNWGATLYDIYFVHRLAQSNFMVSFISGSRMAKWARQHGEARFCKAEIRRAEEAEHHPQRMHPYHIGEFIEFIEQQVHLRKTGRSLKVDKSVNKKIPQCLFPPSEYPDRWPLVPFSTPTCHLQERLPLHKLPKKLIVHDPYNCLNGHTPYISKSEAKWKNRPDKVFTYHLELDQKLQKKKKGAAGIASSADSEETPEAHLFITPKRRIGSGHHSFTYQVEWEVPRVLVVDPKLCEVCACEGKKPTFTRIIGEWLDENYEATAQHPPYCEHLEDGVPRPKATRVSVIAKLTIPKDYEEDHPAQLKNEAKMYQSFPDHFFEHWNGYNLVKPCMDPLPIGAVVPQFYGYYVPDKKHLGQAFKSPILLLENCGVQANMKRLTLEERRECWFLLERLHMADYVHNSVYERNVLIQNGPVQWNPCKRSKLHPRFRLIDFGRTEKSHKNDHKSKKEFDTEQRDMDTDFRLDFGLSPSDDDYRKKKK